MPFRLGVIRRAAASGLVVLRAAVSHAIAGAILRVARSQTRFCAAQQTLVRGISSGHSNSELVAAEYSLPQVPPVRLIQSV
jgi:hypothetical protein